MAVKTLKELANKTEHRFNQKPKNRLELRRAIEDMKLAKQLGIKVSDLK